jgi:PAS domain S-box-containing protein
MKQIGVRISRVVVSLLLVVAVSTAQYVFWDYIRPFAWMMFLPVVFLGSLIGGCVAGVLATFLSAAAVYFLFLPQVLEGRAYNVSSILSVVLFILMGLMISFIHRQLLIQKKRLDEALNELRLLNGDLDRRVSERTLELDKANKALVESEELYRLLAENVSDVIWVHDLETNQLRYVSPSAVRMFGFPAQGSMALPLESSVSERSRRFLAEVVPARMQAFLRGERRTYVDDLEHLCKDGRTIIAETTTRYVRNAKTGHVEVYGTSHDITERKRADDKLKHQEKILRETGKIAKVGGWEFNPGTGEGSWTEEVALIHGLDPTVKTNYALGVSFYEGESRRLIEAAIKETQEEGSGFDLELELITRDGVHKWVRTIGEPVIENDKVVLVRGAFQDITEAKKAEQAIRNLNAELEQRVAERTADLEASNRELESFSYSVSHDLRAPLRAIDGFSRAVMDKSSAALDEEDRACLQRVINAAQRMNQLIDDLLSLSRINRVPLEPQHVDLREIVLSVVDELRHRDPARQAEFSVGESLGVHADPRLIRTVMENLLGNAWKFTSKKDLAHISVNIISGADGERICCVGDNGDGFDMRYADKLFGVFQRLHSAGEFPGSGVGLASVQRIIRRHGGRIWAESNPGQGARFFFSLPDKTADNPESSK